MCNVPCLSIFTPSRWISPTKILGWGWPKLIFVLSLKVSCNVFLKMPSISQEMSAIWNLKTWSKDSAAIIEMKPQPSTHPVLHVKYWKWRLQNYLDTLQHWNYVYWLALISSCLATQTWSMIVKKNITNPTAVILVWLFFCIIWRDKKSHICFLFSCSEFALLENCWKWKWKNIARIVNASSCHS